MVTEQQGEGEWNWDSVSYSGRNISILRSIRTLSGSQRVFYSTVSPVTSRPVREADRSPPSITKVQSMRNCPSNENQTFKTRCLFGTTAKRYVLLRLYGTNIKFRTLVYQGCPNLTCRRTTYFVKDSPDDRTCVHSISNRARRGLNYLEGHYLLTVSYVKSAVEWQGNWDVPNTTNHKEWLIYCMLS